MVLHATVEVPLKFTSTWNGTRGGWDEDSPIVPLCKAPSSGAGRRGWATSRVGFGPSQRGNMNEKAPSLTGLSGVIVPWSVQYFLRTFTLKALETFDDLIITAGKVEVLQRVEIQLGRGVGSVGRPFFRPCCVIDRWRWVLFSADALVHARKLALGMHSGGTGLQPGRFGRGANIPWWAFLCKAGTHRSCLAFGS